MSLSIVAGLPDAGGETFIIEELARAARSGRPALLVVPSAARASSARRMIAETAAVGLRVGTFDGVLLREWSLRGDGRVPAGGLAADHLAAAALREAGVGERIGPGAIALLTTLSQRLVSSAGAPERRPEGLAGRLFQGLMSYKKKLAGHGLVELDEVASIASGFPPPAASIGFMGFASLRPAQERLLVAWSDAADVLVQLPWTAGCPGVEATFPLVERLVAAGGAVIDLGHGHGDRPLELQRVAAGLFGRPQPQPSEGHVRLGVAAGEEAESRLIARIVGERLSAGAAPDQVAVAFADVARHAGWLRHALRDAGIAASVELDASIPETPFGRAMLRLWAFCAGGMRLEDLTSFMRSPFSGVELAQADRADALGRRQGSPAGADLLGLSGRAYPLVAWARRLASRPLDAPTVLEWQELAARMFANAHAGDAPVLDSDAAVDAAAQRSFIRLLDEALLLGPDAPSPGDVMEAYARGRVHARAQRREGRVLVTSLAALSEQTFDHVIIGGLTASEVPRRGPEERLQGDAVGTVVAVLGVGSDPDEHARSERRTFFLAVTAARSSLALVRREADDEGAALRPSVFWDEFLDLYRIPGALEWPVGAPALERADGESGFRGASRRSRGAIEDDEIRASLIGGAVSPSGVEAYVACPYRWYVERVLRPDTPDVVFDRMAAGSLAHSALALFHAQLPALGGRVTAGNLTEAIRVARGCYDEAMQGSPDPRTIEESRLRADMWPAVERTIIADADFLPGFVPAYAEWSFGLDDEPIELGGVVLKGRADRIDIGPEGLVIVDYKLSAAHSLKDIERDGLMQLQLYAAAASERLGLPVAGAVYRSLKTGESRGFVGGAVRGRFKTNDRVETERIAELLEAALIAANEAVDGMRSGDIRPRPDARRCSYCSASAFCPEAMA